MTKSVMQIARLQGHLESAISLMVFLLVNFDSQTSEH